MKMTIFAWVCILSVFLFGQIQNYQVNSENARNPEEVTIAINPTNPAIITAGSNLNYFYRSEDGGETWTTFIMQSAYGVYGDPVVLYDELGTLYYAHLSNPPSNQNGYWIDRIVVQTSGDNGQSWNHDVGVGFRNPRNQDKEWLALDQTDSPFSGNIYMCWTEFDSYGSTSPTDSSRILFSKTSDRGATWSPPVQINDKNGDCLDGDNTVEGAVPAVGPNGEIYVSWSSPYGILFDKSTDGGTTWGTDRPIAPQIGGWAFDVSGISRANGLPFTLCDVSSSPYCGTIYVVWSDQRNGIQDTDVFLVKSSDGGNSWSDVKRINDDQSGRHQFYPNAVVDPITGTLYVVYYDRRGTSGDGTDVYLSRSDDGAETFTHYKISQSTFYPNNAVFFGDYIDIDAFNGMVIPIWMRMDTHTLSVWTAPISDAILTTSNHNNMNRTFTLDPNYPNPFNSSTQISYHLQQTAPVQIKIYNSSGQLVKVIREGVRPAGSYQARLNLSPLPSGLYFYTLQAGSHNLTRKMLLLK